MSGPLYDWPFAALALGVVGFAVLLARPRPRDAAWWIALYLPLYMLHQFEEHGYDLRGDRYAFLHGLCAMFVPAGSAAPCPGDAAFVAAVNPGAVWLAGVIAIAYRRTHPIVGACTWGIVIANIPAHVVLGLATWSYNPGLATAALLFIPCSVLALRAFLRAGVIDPPRIAAIVASGVVLHGILFGSLVARQHGWIDEAQLVAINVAMGCVPLAIGLAVGAPRRRSPS